MGEVYSPPAAAPQKAWMRRAIELARRGEGWTNPNPLVGAVVVKGDRIIGEGFHERYGQAHAERNALAACTEDPADATMYVTLEPCCHTGKQPPCADAVISAGIARVVVGSADPNPLVAGGGVARLRAADIQVEEGFLREECDALNPAFFHFIRSGRPYVVAKWAMTLDGRIATATGDARWVSGEESRADVHRLRHRLAAIAVGIGTVLADDPLLTARLPHPANQPLRVVVDSRLRLPLDSQLVKTAADVPVLVACAMPDSCPQAMALRERGVQVASLPGADGRVDVRALVDALGRRGIDSLLVEGGGALHASMFAAALVNQVVAYVAPKICGGADAKGPVAGAGVARMADAWHLGAPVVERLGDDLKLTYHPWFDLEAARGASVASSARSAASAQGGA